MDIEEFFPEGEWLSEEEYVIQCPFCQDHRTHNHCYINVARQVFYCHYCGEKGFLKELLKKCEIRGTPEPKKGIVEKKKYEPVDFSQFPRVRGHIESTLDILAYTYLKKRGLSGKEIGAYDIRYSDSGRYYGRVLIPIKEDNRVVNFVGRSFMNCIKPKYLYPHTGETLITSNEAIFGFDRAAQQSRGIYVLVEGIFDAIRVNRRKENLGILGLAVLSKYLSEGQLYKLLKLKGGIIFLVMFDSDAHKDAFVAAKKLAAYGRDVRLCFLSKGDPDSLSDDEFDDAINASKEVSLGLELETLMK